MDNIVPNANIMLLSMAHCGEHNNYNRMSDATYMQKANETMSALEGCDIPDVRVSLFTIFSDDI